MSEEKTHQSNTDDPGDLQPLEIADEPTSDDETQGTPLEFLAAESNAARKPKKPADGVAPPRATAPQAPADHAPAPEPPRRSFFVRFITVIIGGLVTLVPAAAGLWTFFDPLLRRGRGRENQYLPVAPVEAVPANGTPRKFEVIADRTDAWNRYPQVPIGAVYLRRTGNADQPIEAINVICPHAGCFVNLGPQNQKFTCPCHESEFKLDGDIIPITASGKQTVSPRGLDTLDVLVEKGMVKVDFKNFVAGTHEKIPQS